MNKILYTISSGKQNANSKLFHLTFLLDSPSSKLDHVQIMHSTVYLLTQEATKIHYKPVIVVCYSQPAKPATSSV